MKKIIATFCALMLIGAVASAEQVTLNMPTISNDEVTVTGSIPAGYEGQKVSVQIIKPNGSIGNLSDVFYLREIDSEETGNFTHSFTMPQTDMNGNDTTGIYLVYAGSKGLDASALVQPEPGADYIQSFFYCTTIGRAAFIQNVEDASNVSELKTLITGAEGKKILAQIGLITSEYDDLDDTQEANVNNTLLGATFDKEEDFIKAYNDAIILELANANLSDNSLAMQEVRVFGDYLEFDYEFYDGFGSEATSCFDLIVNEKKGTLWQSAGDFRKAVSGAFAVIDINAVTDFRDMWEVAGKYTDVLEFNEADVQYYTELTSENDIYTINKALTNQNFTTTEAVKTAFENAIKVDKQRKAQANNRPTGGGGSGSGGVVVGTVTQPSMPGVQGTPTQNQFFNDVAEKHWAYDCIKELKIKGIVNGDEKGNFNPEQTLTREIFVTMLSIALNLPDADSSQEFSDVAEGAWYEDYIKQASKYNIVKGIDGERFGVGMELSRQDMAVMIYRAAKYMKVELMPEDAGVAFADDSNIAIYAKEAVYSLKNSGIINGIDAENFAPKAKSTKAQAARLIYGLISAK